MATKLQFNRKPKIEIDGAPVEDGVVWFSTDTQEIFMDNGDVRDVYNGQDVDVSETEPTNDSTKMWINPSFDEIFQVPEIKDDEVSDVDTWSSKKIDEKIKEKSIYFNNVESMKADNSLKEGDVAVTLGYYEPNDGGGATYRIRTKLEDDVDDGGSIHELINGNVAELVVEGGYINVKKFGIKGNGEEETDKIQNIINFYEYILFPKGTYSFKNIKISKNISIICFDSIFKPINKEIDTNTVYNMLYSEDEIDNIYIYGACFEGEFKSGSNKDEEQTSIIDFYNSNNVTIECCKFNTITNKNQIIPSDIKLRKAMCITLKDCNKSIIRKCKFDNLIGEEVIFIRPVNKNIYDINILIDNNVFTNINTSCATCIGGKIETTKNIANYNFDGSLFNLFGKYVYSHDEEIFGNFSSVYDTTEDGRYSSEKVTIENISIIGNVNYAIVISMSKFLIIENIKNNIECERGIQIYFNHYSDISDSYQEDNDLKDCYLTISNSYLYCNNIIRALNTFSLDDNYNFNITINNSVLNTNKTILYINNGDVLINNCVLFNGITGQSSNAHTIESVSDHIIKNITIIGCKIISKDKDKKEPLLIGSFENAIVIGNKKDGTISNYGSTIIGDYNINYE